MADKSFYYENLTCCSLDLHWKEEDNANLNFFELYQREGGHNAIANIYYRYNIIYKGKNTSYEVINLKPEQIYDFKLKIFKTNSTIEKETSIKTLISPHAILSEKSIDIANDEKLIGNSNDLQDIQNKLIKNCAKLIFDENDEDIIKGNFDEIEIKIAYELENNIYYISFDINSKYFNQFFKQFIEEYEKIY